MRGWGFCAVAGALLVATSAMAAPPPLAARAGPVEVMVVGVFHMSNPGHDLFNTHVDDVLAPKRQAEIADVVDHLAGFRPTKVAVEWDADKIGEPYRKYLAGALGPSRNEVVQLGFRLAKAASAPVYGIDADGDLPFPQLWDFAKAHGQWSVIERSNAAIQAHVAEAQKRIDRGSIGSALRFLNSPDEIWANNASYREMLRVGSGADQPGADLEAAWYRRNFLICAHLLQLARPGDRLVVFFGSGHAYQLRQCVTETPGMKLVDALGYLPR